MAQNRWQWRNWRWLAAGLIGWLLLIGPLLNRKQSLPELGMLAWLIPLAIYDWQKREVPHIAFVALPCGLAAVTAIFRGDWTLSLLTILIVAVSERRHLPKGVGVVTFVIALIACATLLLLTPFEKTPGAIAIIGFWLAYELGWWAGADALAAITLAIHWPDVRLLVCLAIAHLGLALFINKTPLLILPRRLSSLELERFGVAGMPAIAVGAVLFSLWQGWTM